MSRPLDQRIQEAFLRGFAQSDLARVIAAEAERRGFGKVRVDSASPQIVLIAEAGDEKALAEFGAWASATAGTAIHAKPVSAYPAWRQRAMWDGAIAVEPSEGMGE